MKGLSMKYLFPAACAFAASLAMVPQPLLAEGSHDHGSEAAHLAEAHGLRVLHAWAPAAGPGDALIYMEIRNETGQPAKLTGAEGDWAEDFVLSGAMLRNGEMQRVELSELVVPAEGRVMLEPQGAAITAHELRETIAEGESRDLHLRIGEAEIKVEIQVLSADAKTHPHAGHNH